jgi:hypothetical protein
LTLGAGEPRLQLTNFLAQQLDAFFGFLVHGGGRKVVGCQLVTEVTSP